MRSDANKPNLFVVDPYHTTAISKLATEHSIRLVLPDDPLKDEWPQRATALLVRSETKFTADVLAQASDNLKFIVKQGVGVDNIDLAAASKKGIKVFNTPALNSEAVAELTIALAFCVSRRIAEIDRLIRNGSKVVRSKLLGKSLFGKTLGVVGMGNIGVEVAKKWVGAMNGKVVAFDPYAPQDAWSEEASLHGFKRAQELEELMKQSDVVTLHVPLTSSTRNLLSRQQLSWMKRGSILLNCSRGSIVDEVALLDCLNSEHLFGVGLDAVEHEPPTMEVYGETLLSHPRVVITPHIGASTEENQENSGLAAVGIVLDLLEGGRSAEKHRPLN